MRKSIDLLKILFLFIGMFVLSNVHAQQKTITGTVTDSDGGDPIPGATVYVKGTTNGTITTSNGTYSIEASQGSTLVFSFIGFTTQEVLLGQQTELTSSWSRK